MFLLYLLSLPNKSVNFLKNITKLLNGSLYFVRYSVHSVKVI